MPELSFKGKEFVFNHHLAVPFRPLNPRSDLSIGEPRLDGNLIVHGDNLHALKALLPLYAGKVDVIYIDPPYNTGNEKWSYNDNVNSPFIREWLAGNPIAVDDGLRHDKWCSMMWPRLRLLKELLSDDGTIFVSIDDNEARHLLSIMDAIFGADNFVATFIWRKVDSPNDNKVAITPDHEYVICYSHDRDNANFAQLAEPAILHAYPNRADDGRHYRDRLLKKNGRESLRRDRESMFFPIPGPDGIDVYPIHDNGEEARWAMGTRGVARHQAARTLIWKQREKGGRVVWEPYTREYAPPLPERPYPTIWTDLPTMRQAKAMLREIFATADLFDTPKPIELIQRLLDLVNRPDALVLDSFAGSGTTAHAVLAANKRDGGRRRFILVEAEDYASSLTAERVRRVINGYEFSGTSREELLKERITWTVLKRSGELVDRVDASQNLDGHRFDRIKKEVKDGYLVVTGEKAVESRTEGLGGSFTFCDLGEPLDLDRLLSGASLPSFEALGSVLFHMATNHPFDPTHVSEEDGFGYLGDAGALCVWLIYKPDLEFLRSTEAALTLARARELSARKPGKHNLVFAPARFVSQKLLNENGLSVEFAPLPFALYRIERS